MPARKLYSQEIVSRFRSNGPRWLSIPRDAAEELFRLADEERKRSGREWSECVATTDLLYWLDTKGGEGIKPYRYYSKRWGWPESRVYRFIRRFIEMYSPPPADVRSSGEAAVKQKRSNGEAKRRDPVKIQRGSEAKVKQPRSRSEATVKQYTSDSSRLESETGEKTEEGGLVKVEMNVHPNSPATVVGYPSDLSPNRPGASERVRVYSPEVEGVADYWESQRGLRPSRDFRDRVEELLTGRATSPKSGRAIARQTVESVRAAIDTCAGRRWNLDSLLLLLAGERETGEREEKSVPVQTPPPPSQWKYGLEAIGRVRPGEGGEFYRPLPDRTPLLWRPRSDDNLPVPSDYAEPAPPPGGTAVAPNVAGVMPGAITSPTLHVRP